MAQLVGYGFGWVQLGPDWVENGSVKTGWKLGLIRWLDLVNKCSIGKILMNGSDLMDLNKRGGWQLRWMMSMMVKWWDLRVGHMDDEI